MKEIRATFLDRIDRTETVSSFRFLPKEPVDFCAGQFLQVIFDQGNRTNKSLNKYLSFSCRPGKGFIELTKRKSDSDFCKKLLDLKKEDEVLLKGPMGTCVFDKAFEKIAFLIGGIGITPVTSMLEHIVYNNLPVDAAVVYSNLQENDIPFKGEFDLWREKENIRVIYTIVEENPQNKDYFKGVITADLVSSQIPDFKDRIFFISGPPKMVEAMRTICQGLGCDMNKVKTENFIGY
ncbi:MAG: FAD-dependent oxidoreductase [Candidatus Aceula meridiana]|nr:FAD-dependent oxidoreductase [Candidatus Aceula meridiana]